MPVLDEGLGEFAVCSDSEIECSYPICRFEIVPQRTQRKAHLFFSSLMTVKFWWPFCRKLGAGVLRVVYFHLLLSVKLCVLKVERVNQNPGRSWCWVWLALGPSLLATVDFEGEEAVDYMLPLTSLNCGEESFGGGRKATLEAQIKKDLDFN